MIIEDKESRKVAELVAKEYQTPRKKIEYIIGQHDKGATIPFLTRYRAFETGNKSADELRNIIKSYQSLENFFSEQKNLLYRAGEIFEGRELEKVTEEIKKCPDLRTLDLIKANYFPARKTKAVIAREKGFGQVSGLILKSKKTITKDDLPAHLLKNNSEEEIFTGAIEIIISEFTLDPEKREFIKSGLAKYGGISSKLLDLEKIPESSKNEVAKYKIYHDFSCKFSYLKNHQFLALKRAEKKGIIKYSFVPNEILKNNFLKYFGKYKEENEQFTKALKNSYSKIFESVWKELFSESYQIAQEASIEIFKKNLKQLLYMTPHYHKKVLAVDPGYKNGCKFAIIDDQKLYQSGLFRLEQKAKFKIILSENLKNYEVNIIVVGNGTASTETCTLISEFLKELKVAIPILIVDECGASVYSVSEAAEVEFPDLKPLFRSAVSIGRRYIDSLSELVKIPVHSLGVGLYQHDISEKKLETALNEVVVDAVNDIGINLNSASYYLLRNASGLNKKSARKLADNLPINSRKELRKLLGTKGFEQAAGFLLIEESTEELDKTFIHPDQYKIMSFLLENENSVTNDPIDFFNKNKANIIKLAKDEIESPKQLTNLFNLYKENKEAKREKSGLIDFAHLEENLQKKIEPGTILNGIVRNVSPFGIFVDAGIKQTILIHISAIRKKKLETEDFQINEMIKFKISRIDEQHDKINGELFDIVKK